MNMPARAAGLSNGAEVFALAWAEGLRIPKPLPVDEWADEYQILPRESSAEPGPWRTSRTPYLREPMQVLSDDHPAKETILMFGTQTGKTSVGNNWLGSVIHQTPGPAMMVQPTYDMGQRWMRQRFAPMVRQVPVLTERVKSSRSREGGSTGTMKEYPGGALVLAWSNSAANLSSMPVKFLFMDETDRYPDDVDGEGHPCDVAERRTSSYSRRKILKTSSPTVKGESVIEDDFERSDQRHYYVPCPHCGHEHVLIDEHLTDDGRFVCSGCGSHIEEHHKTAMLAAGRWIASNPESDIVGFHLPSYYAPIGLGYTWKEIADLRAQARKNPGKEKTYTNTIMAETYEDESGKVDWKEIADRAGGYSSREIPDGCLMLTAGVDTQDDRWAVKIMGFGRGHWYTIDWFEIPGEPGTEEEWKKLDQAVLNVTFRNRYGVDMKVLAMAVDTGGHHTHMVYQYCRTRKHKRVLAVKGSKFQGRPIMPTRPSPQDVNVRGQIIRAGVDLYHVGTDTAKGAIFAKLQADAGADHEDQRYRFPGDLPDDFYQQLTAERYDSTKQRWVKPRHARNEALDCSVYALAAACHPAIRFDKLRENEWKKIEAKVQPVVKDLFADAPESVATTRAESPKEQQEHLAVSETPEPAKPERKQPTTKPKSKRRKKSSGFVGSWKQ